MSPSSDCGLNGHNYALLVTIWGFLYIVTDLPAIKGIPVQLSRHSAPPGMEMDSLEKLLRGLIFFCKKIWKSFVKIIVSILFSWSLSPFS